MTDPQTQADFEERFARNTEVTGYGVDVEQHCPCPWCAAADFMVMRIASGVLTPGPSLDEQMRTPATCSECGRTGVWEVTRTESSVEARFFQTGGPDPPNWMADTPHAPTRIA